MIRTQIFITEKQSKVIKKLGKETGLPSSEIIRRILDYYIANENIKDISKMKKVR